MSPSAPKHSPRRAHLTHFLCLPLTTPSSIPQLQTTLRRFSRDNACDIEEDGGYGRTKGTAAGAPTVDAGGRSNEETRPEQKPTVPRPAVRPPGTLHLTIGVMSLTTPGQIQQACDFLQTLDVRGTLLKLATPPAVEDDLAEGEPHLSPAAAPSIRISLSSLHSMQSPARSSVLYAIPRPQQPLLQPLAQFLHDAFLQAGLLIPSFSSNSAHQDTTDGNSQHGSSKPRGSRELKLHATIVNTIYAGMSDQPTVNEGKPLHGDVARLESKQHHMSESARGECTYRAEEALQRTRALRETIKMQAEKKEENSELNKDKTLDRAPANKEKLETINRNPQAHNGRGQARKRRQRGKIFIDARELVQQYRDHIWASDFRLDRIAICEMGAKKIYQSAEADMTTKEDVNVNVHVDVEPDSDINTRSYGDQRNEKGGNQIIIDERYTEICSVELP